MNLRKGGRAARRDGPRERPSPKPSARADSSTSLQDPPERPVSLISSTIKSTRAIRVSHPSKRRDLFAAPHSCSHRREAHIDLVQSYFQQKMTEYFPLYNTNAPPPITAARRTNRTGPALPRNPPPSWSSWKFLLAAAVCQIPRIPLASASLFSKQREKARESKPLTCRLVGSGIKLLCPVAVPMTVTFPVGATVESAAV